MYVCDVRKFLTETPSVGNIKYHAVFASTK